MKCKCKRKFAGN